MDFGGQSPSRASIMNLTPEARKEENSNQRAKVWKLSDPSLSSSPSVQFPNQANNFTLQEILFVEQLAAIEERVRSQVPMEASQVEIFLECALTGSPISQTTIMHAYQTCIKRIVRFANSLQDFVELPPDDMQKLLVSNTVSIINIRLARWFHPKTNLETQLALCGPGVDLLKEAGGQPQEGRSRVNYEDVFS